MRLYRHDEIVEAMTRAIDEAFAFEYPHLSRWAATAALDAMLEAVVRLEVGTPSQLEFGGARYHAPQADALILKLEPKP